MKPPTSCGFTSATRAFSPLSTTTGGPTPKPRNGYTPRSARPCSRTAELARRRELASVADEFRITGVFVTGSSHGLGSALAHAALGRDDRGVGAARQGPHRWRKVGQQAVERHRIEYPVQIPDGRG